MSFTLLQELLALIISMDSTNPTKRVRRRSNASDFSEVDEQHDGIRGTQQEAIINEPHHEEVCYHPKTATKAACNAKLRGTCVLAGVTEICHHELFCEERGRFKWHKGIDPAYPKGYYCCRDACFASDKTLRICHDREAVVLSVLGIFGRPLGYLDDNVSELVKESISANGEDIYCH
jgi:hypothetical protein